MKVLVSIPNTGWIHKHTAFVALRLANEKRHEVNIIMPTHNPFENNLHHIIVDLLKGDYDYWLTIDADNPPINNPLDLIDLDKDIIGLPTPVYHFTGKIKGERPYYFNAYDYVEGEDAYREHKEMKGLQKVDAVGTGCVLFKRRVFEHPNMQNGCFTRKLKENGCVDKGNDISFCERARENGFEIYAHYDYMCRHFNEIELSEMILAFNEIQYG